MPSEGPRYNSFTAKYSVKQLGDVSAGRHLVLDLLPQPEPLRRPSLLDVRPYRFLIFCVFAMMVKQGGTSALDLL